MYYILYFKTIYAFFKVKWTKGKGITDFEGPYLQKFGETIYENLVNLINQNMMTNLANTNLNNKRKINRNRIIEELLAHRKICKYYLNSYIARDDVVQVVSLLHFRKNLKKLHC